MKMLMVRRYVDAIGDQKYLPRLQILPDQNSCLLHLQYNTLALWEKTDKDNYKTFLQVLSAVLSHKYKDRG